jgi:hypothetical protein
VHCPAEDDGAHPFSVVEGGSDRVRSGLRPAGMTSAPVVTVEAEFGRMGATVTKPLLPCQTGGEGREQRMVGSRFYRGLRKELS